MKYISLFSGIEAASVAWEPLGWEPVAFAEIEEFPSAVLAARYPNVPNLGDVFKVDWSKYRGAADLIVGGTPCQAFSIAGKREGLLDPRGQLMLEFVRAARETHVRWLLWENVPGCLSQDRGRAFGTLLRELDELGYSCAWRVLDAQFARVPVRDGDGRIARWVGPVPQRRRRVFLVGHLGSGGCPVAVLFEPESLRGDHPSGRKAREALAADAAGRTEPADSIAIDYKQTPKYSDNVSHTLTHEGDGGIHSAVAFAQNQREEVRFIGGDGRVASSQSAQQFGTHKNEMLLCEPMVMADNHAHAEIGVGGVAPTLKARGYKDPPILFSQATETTCSQVSARQTATSNSSTISQSAGEG